MRCWGGRAAADNLFCRESMPGPVDEIDMEIKKKKSNRVQNVEHNIPRKEPVVISIGGL